MKVLTTLGTKLRSIFLTSPFRPFRAIPKKRFAFGSWLIFILTAGLMGFWLPYFALVVSGHDARAAFSDLVGTGILASFCIVLLTEGISSSLIVQYGGSSKNPGHLLIMAGGIAAIVGAFQVAFLVVRQLQPTITTWAVPLQIFATFLAVCLASYLFCFRFPELWVAGLDGMLDEQNKDIGVLEKDAAQNDTDNSGVTL